LHRDGLDQLLISRPPLTILTFMSSSESPKVRVVPAPEPSNPDLRSTVLNVDCADDEDVEWHWTETAAGRFVSGYSLVPRTRSPE
jgi:hypothetical protein